MCARHFLRCPPAISEQAFDAAAVAAIFACYAAGRLGLSAFCQCLDDAQLLIRTVTVGVAAAIVSRHAFAKRKRERSDEHG